MKLSVSRLLLLLFFWSPKNALLTSKFGDITSIEIIFLLSLPLIILSKSFSLKSLSNTGSKFVVIIILTYLVGLPFRLFFGDWGSLVYILRFTEYLTIGSLALFVSRRFLLLNIFLSLAAALILDLAEIDYSLFKYMQWETSMIAAMFALSLFYRETISPNGKAITLLLATLHTIISGQRSPLLVLFIPIYLSARRNFFKVCLVIMLAFVALVSTNNPLIDRISIIFNPDTLEMAQEIVSSDAASDITGYSYQEFIDIDRNTESTDTSLILRLKKWSYQFNTLDEVSFLVGKGAFAFGRGADSSLIRIFIETGLIGFLLFIFLTIKLFSRSNLFQKALFGSFLMLGLFIDAWFSSGITIYFLLLSNMMGYKSQDSNLHGMSMEIKR